MINALLSRTSLVKSLRAQLAEAQKELRSLQKKPARITIEGGLSEQAIIGILAGSETLPVVKAVVALISAEVVELSDIATDRPRETISRETEIIKGYSESERLHDAGGASHLSEILAKIQDYSKPRDPETAAKTA